MDLSAGHAEAMAASADREPSEFRDAAIDALVEEALASVPDWVKYDYEWRGIDIKAVARESVTEDTKAVRERCLVMEQEHS